MDTESLIALIGPVLALAGVGVLTAASDRVRAIFRSVFRHPTQRSLIAQVDGQTMVIDPETAKALRETVTAAAAALSVTPEAAVLIADAVMRQLDRDQPQPSESAAEPSAGAGAGRD